jgi:signal recognition particle receptor subunit beta
MVSLETESDRTLFFDLLPIEVGTIGGFKTRLQLYTVPGQVFYNTTRKLVLKGVDGLVFVADSQRPMREANLESLESLRSNLKELGLGIDDLPLVIQFNKRDLKNILTVEELVEDLNPDNAYPCFEASAINGDGVFETLKEITKLTLKKLRKRMASPQASTGRPRPAMAPVRPPDEAAPRRPASISAAALARAAEEGVESEQAEAAEAALADTPPQAEPPPDVGAAAPVGSGETPPADEGEQSEVEVFEAAQSTSDAAAEAAEPMHEPPAPVAPGPVATDEETEPRAAEGDPPGEPFGDIDDDGAAGPADDIGGGTPPRNEEMTVEFSQTEVEGEVPPPPMKRVHVSNQMDILAELDDLRKQSTTEAGAPRRTRATADVDIDSLLGTAVSTDRELRRRLEKSINSNIFKRMHGVQIAVRIQDAAGDTIHTLDPVSLRVEEAGGLKRLSLQLTVDLENSS